ncbi:ribonuclease P protein component [Pelagibius marinus]|uniref:ribonuclease P protein component n=1 Tax=Pelagibius marinus TaxID=2762760 RepID=UPI001872973B|nr:ribonuclease P protein component [Pelagibius marinus]
MMPTVGRLKTRPQFLKVAAARRKWVTPGLVLQAARRQPGDDRAAPGVRAAEAKADREQGDREEAEVRVGFTVTRKVGNAVARNRAKRRLRAAAAEIFAEHGRAGTDYVVIGRAGTLTRPYDALRRDLEQAIVKVERHGGSGGPRDGKRRPAKGTARKEASQ